MNGTHTYIKTCINIHAHTLTHTDIYTCTQYILSAKPIYVRNVKKPFKVTFPPIVIFFGDQVSEKGGSPFSKSEH